MTDELPQLPPVALPESLPPDLPRSQFQIGESVRWITVPDPDFGRVIGMIYAPAATHQVMGLHYLILLDAASPSRSICLHDFAFEQDIERLDRTTLEAAS